jgi:hypothetical protein
MLKRVHDMKNKSVIIFMGVCLGIILLAFLYNPAIFKGEHGIQIEKRVLEKENENVVQNNPPVLVEDEKVVCERVQKGFFEGGKDSFAKGSLIVVFQEGIDFNSAKNLVVESGANPDIENESSYKGWMNVRVPQGKEVEILCGLRESDNIKSVSYNVLFELHE